MKRTVHLYGHLSKFIDKIKLDVNSVGEAIRALEANFPGFIGEIKRDKKYRVVVGKDLKSGHPLDDTTVFMEFKKGDIFIMPIIAGSGGFLRAVFGGVLIVASYIFPAAAPILKPLGVSLLLGGIAEMLTPTPTFQDYANREPPEERPSFLFTGPVNVVEQGGPVPVVYGQMIIGSTVVSAALDTEDVDS